MELQVKALAPEEVASVSERLGLARLHQGNGHYLVAWQGGEPVGHAYLALTDPPEMQDVQVRPGHRRQGVATTLCAAVEAEAEARGFDRVRLEVSAQEPAVQTLYRRLGYRDAGVPPRRVLGTVHIRTGPLEVDDTLLTWEKPLPVRPPGRG